MLSRNRSRRQSRSRRPSRRKRAGAISRSREEPTTATETTEISRIRTDVRDRTATDSVRMARVRADRGRTALRIDPTVRVRTDSARGRTVTALRVRRTDRTVRHRTAGVPTTVRDSPETVPTVLPATDSSGTATGRETITVRASADRAETAHRTWAADSATRTRIPEAAA